MAPLCMQSILTLFGIESTNLEHISSSYSSRYKVLITSQINSYTVKAPSSSFLVLHFFYIKKRIFNGFKVGKISKLLEDVYFTFFKNWGIFWKYAKEQDLDEKYDLHQEKFFHYWKEVSLQNCLVFIAIRHSFLLSHFGPPL